MPRTQSDVENYLTALGYQFEVDSSTIVLHSGNGTPIAIHVSDPLVAINVVIGGAPPDEARALKVYRRLLELNATDLMHASYGLDGERIVLSAALPLENLDSNELQATLSDIEVALVRHTGQLIDLAKSQMPPKP